MQKMFCDRQSEQLEPEITVNADETCFTINMDGGRTFNRRDNEHLKCVDVVSKSESMTMIVSISEAEEARIKLTIMIFMNMNFNYPIRAVLDNIHGVTNCIDSKDWIGRRTINSERQREKCHKDYNNSRRLF